MGDLNSKRGRILGMEKSGNLQVIKANVPLSEMYRYAIDLKSITQGRGTFTMGFSRTKKFPLAWRRKSLPLPRLKRRRNNNPFCLLDQCNPKNKFSGFHRVNFVLPCFFYGVKGKIFLQDSEVKKMQREKDDILKLRLEQELPDALEVHFDIREGKYR